MNIFFDLVSPYQNVDNSQANKDDLPSEFCLFKYGLNRAYHMGEGDKEISFTQTDADRLIDAYLDSGVELPVDYEHQALDGSTGPKASAGWFSLEKKEDGIYAVNVRWTPKASQMLKDREYRYFSPAVEKDEDGNMCRMLPAALTNLPALKGIKALMNNMINKNLQKDKTMSDEKVTVEALAAVDSKRVEALSQVEEMKKEIAKLNKDKETMEVNGILDKAILEGRLAPAKRQELLSKVETFGIQGLKYVIESLPIIAKTETVVGFSQTATSSELTKFEKDMARHIGVSYEAFSAQKLVTAERLNMSKHTKSDVAYDKIEILSRTLTPSPEYLEKCRTVQLFGGTRGAIQMKPDQITIGYGNRDKPDSE